MKCPTTLPERQAARDVTYQRVMLRAEREAYTLVRSLKCGGFTAGPMAERHSGDVDGCANDGTGCLCECHDPKESP